MGILDGMPTPHQAQLGTASRKFLTEPFIVLPLSAALATLLVLRMRGPLSRPERAALRKELFLALDAATGQKGHP